MSTLKLSLLSGLCAAFVCVGFSYPAAAEQQYGPLKIEAGFKSQITTIDNADLKTGSDEFQDSESLEARLRATLSLSDDVTAMGEARGVKNYGGPGIDIDTGESLGQKDFLEMRQLWVQARSIMGYVPVSAKLGRQRFSESAGTWWNRDFDAVRVSYNTTLLNGFIAVGQNLAAYRTTGDDYQRSDEDIFRAMGETSWQWKYGHFLESRFMYMDDHSGLNPLGTLLPTDDRDTLDSNLFWSGLRARGEVTAFPNAEKASYRVDLMGVTGDEKIESTVAGPTGFRSVSGYGKRDVDGWAIDSLLYVPLPVSAKPELTLGYAFGSGDDNPADDKDHGFRQTGLDSNSSRSGLSAGSVYNFGSVLRPDISNIHILTAGVIVPVFKATDISGIYHYYRLDKKAASLSTGGISAPLNNEDHDLGHGVDILINTNLSQEFGFDASVVGPVTMKTSIGAFRSGAAYGAAEGEWSSRGYMELQIKF